MTNESNRPRPLTLREQLAPHEKAVIQAALNQYGGSRQETARVLGINRTTLFNKMRKYGLMKTPLPRSRQYWQMTCLCACNDTFANHTHGGRCAGPGERAGKPQCDCAEFRHSPECECQKPS